MALMVQIIHRDGTTGVFEPGDAYPPMRVEFIGGQAFVPKTVFDSAQFQAYAAPRIADGEWMLQPELLTEAKAESKTEDAREKVADAEAKAEAKLKAAAMPKKTAKPRQPKPSAVAKPSAVKADDARRAREAAKAAAAPKPLPRQPR